MPVAFGTPFSGGGGAGGTVKLMGSIINVPATNVLALGGPGFSATTSPHGQLGRYVLAYNTNYGSPTDETRHRFQPFSGAAVASTPIQSANPYHTGLNTPNIPGLEGGAEAYGLLPLNVSDVFTTQFTSTLAPTNAKLALIRLDEGWSYNYPGYDMVMIANLGTSPVNTPKLGFGATTTTAFRKGGWQNDVLYGGSGTDLVLSQLDAGKIFVTLVPEAASSITIGSNIGVPGYQERTFGISDNSVVYLTDQLVETSTATTSFTEGALIHFDTNQDSVVNFGELHLSRADGSFSIPVNGTPRTVSLQPLSLGYGPASAAFSTTVPLGGIVQLPQISTTKLVNAGLSINGFEGIPVSFFGSVQVPAGSTGAEYRWTISNAVNQTVSQGAWVAVSGTADVPSSFEFLPRDEGTYFGRLELRGLSSTNANFNYFDVKTSEIREVSPQIELGEPIQISEGVVYTWNSLLSNLSSDNWLVQIDSDGDGIFEYSFNTKESLKDLEYAWRNPSRDNGDTINPELIPYQFRVRVTDEDDDTVSEDTVAVTVLNASPVLVTSNISLNEGTPIGNRIRFRDGADSWTATATYSDGTSETATIVADPSDPFGVTWIVQLNHAFANEGNYAISLRIDDQTDGTSVTYPVNVSVLNSAPQYLSAIVGPSNLTESTTAVFSIAATDVSADTIVYQWDFNYDGVNFDVDQVGSNVEFHFPDQGTFEVAVRSTDGLNAAGILTQSVSVTNSAPVVDVNEVQTVWQEGTTIQVAGGSVVRDAFGDSVSYLWQLFDGGTVPIFTSTSPLFSFPTSNQATYTLKLLASDEDGGSSEAEWGLSVANVAPLFELTVSGTLIEGNSVTIDATNIVDQGTEDVFSYEWSAVGPNGETLPLIGTTSVQLIPPDEGVYWVTLSIHDGTNSTVRTTKIDIANLNPVLSNLSGGGSTATSQPLTLSGLVSDAGAADELTGVVDLGDGVLLPLELKSGNFRLDYQFRQSGQYNVSVTIRDLDGGVSQQTLVHRVDVDPAIVSVNSYYTNDVTPSITGTINDNGATILVTIGGQDYSAINGANGTWTLPDNAISPPLGSGRHLVRVLATDLAGNESLITGSVTVVLHHPEDIFITQAIVNENTDTSAADVLFGELGVVDQDEVDLHTYELVSGSGDIDNGRFVISDNKLAIRQGQVLDFESNSVYSVRVRVRDAVGNPYEESIQLSVTDVNEPVVLTRTNASVSGNVLTQLTNTGNWSDPESGTVTLSASLGTVTKNADGTWSWSYQPTVGMIGQAVTISANDGTNVSTTTFNVTAYTTVATRGLLYVGATGASASTSLATDKTALLPGQSSTFANYTNYSRGLNGLVIDVTGLPATVTDAQLAASLQFANWNGIAAAGFVALPGAAVPTVAIIAGGVAGSTRVSITFPSNTVQNTWLRVTLVANANTRLAANDVFYFGNVIGELDFGNTATRLRVNGQDAALILANQSPGANTAAVTNKFDLDRNGRVNGQDYAILLANQQAAGIVAPITAPSSRSAPARGSSDTSDGSGSTAPLQSPSSSSKSTEDKSDGRETQNLRSNVSSKLLDKTLVIRGNDSDNTAVSVLNAMKTESDKTTETEDNSTLENLDTVFASWRNTFRV